MQQAGRALMHDGAKHQHRQAKLTGEPAECAQFTLRHPAQTHGTIAGNDEQVDGRGGGENVAH